MPDTPTGPHPIQERIDRRRGNEVIDHLKSEGHETDLDPAAIGRAVRKTAR